MTLLESIVTVHTACTSVLNADLYLDFTDE